MTETKMAVKKIRSEARARAARPTKPAEKFASLSPELLGRDEETVITRPGAIVYSQESADAAIAAQEFPRIAVTFRMEKAEFIRLRKGADHIGVKPRDVVHRAIKNCLDAYGVKPNSGKPAL